MSLKQTYFILWSNARKFRVKVSFLKIFNPFSRKKFLFFSKSVSFQPNELQINPQNFPNFHLLHVATHTNHYYFFLFRTILPFSPLVIKPLIFLDKLDLMMITIIISADVVNTHETSACVIMLYVDDDGCNFF